MPEYGTGVRQVSIRPGTKILGSLRYLNYKAWFALAEFVDNALQSFLANRERLAAATSGQRLVVRIDVQSGMPGRISIRDNAAGIGAADFQRAFRPAEVPPDATGLSEFGMGMKSAACWFASRWHVRTSALGEPVQRTVRFDIERIVADDIEEVSVEEVPAEAGSHFTEIILEDLHVALAGRTLGKVRDHLRDIYRCFLRDGTLTLEVGGVALAYVEPEVLHAPYYRAPADPPILWRKDIDLDFGGGQTVRGFAALRREGKGAEAGFALFRRNRLIQGSGDEGWKHADVFGSPNSYSHQRLFGELHLDGFEVSHTKDGFRWADEADFAQLLAGKIDEGLLPMLRQAEGHRQNAPRSTMQRSAMSAISATANDMRSHLAAAMPPAADRAATTELLVSALAPSPPALLADSEFSFEFRGAQWTVAVRISDDDGAGDWLEVRDAELIRHGLGGRHLEIWVSSAHPFMTRFAQREPEVVQALVRVAASLGIAEALLRNLRRDDPSAVRRTANELLRDVFSSL
ncbi:ATP-binding protein [Methylobacterium sp. W2]|uniref:ATP-binding protein n=1 Tax=Methylobacterium sp. W2 TaxID=2598107 RepID=UPI001D0CB03D|nr:ATP-binding protein [Methylobacterium sp. W2]MCC0808664.1 ATP-binding protein [Methylobacterium sp. W2]